LGGLGLVFSTGLTDGCDEGIGALGILLPRDVVLVEPKHPSAPV